MTSENGAESASPERASMVAAARDLASGDLVSVRGGILTKVHRPNLCLGTNCWVHNPSEHHMVTWQIDWRERKRTAERLCPHDIGHPDPDDVAFNARLGRDVTDHSCDGCCVASLEVSPAS